MNLIFYNRLDEVRDHIKNCQDKEHVQQVAYSTYHDGMTQVCFACDEVRTNIKHPYLTPIDETKSECKITSCQQENCLPHCPCDCHNNRYEEIKELIKRVRQIDRVNGHWQSVNEYAVEDIGNKVNEIINKINSQEKK